MNPYLYEDAYESHQPKPNPFYIYNYTNLGKLNIDP